MRALNIKNLSHGLIRSILLIALFVPVGCTTTGQKTVVVQPSTNEAGDQVLVDQPLNENKDPLERVNRKILNFNLKFDKYMGKPAAKIYVKITPKIIRKGIRNFFSNLWEPMTIINDVLQAKFVPAIRDTTRFIINSTIGIVGIFDVAKHLNLNKQGEDFGQTMAVWGLPSGPFLMLPLLGPSNVRDTIGLVPQYLYTDLLAHFNKTGRYVGRSLRVVDSRSQLLGVDDLLEFQLDPYIHLRETYRHLRRRQIRDNRNEDADQDSSHNKSFEDELLEDDF